MSADKPPSHWDEDTSQNFLDYGKYFIPAREQQIGMMSALLKGVPQPAQVLELGCGEGLLAEQILDSLPTSRYLGLDGSAVMLYKAAQRLSRFGERCKLSSFELADRSWRRSDAPIQAVVSSLAIHHLRGKAKQLLFKDIYTMLCEGGGLIIADMVAPVTEIARLVAADAWDDVVRRRSLELDGSTAGLNFFQKEGWNTYRYPDEDDIDHPSSLLDQLKWLEKAGFRDIDVHFFEAGHALFSGYKPSAGK